MNLFIKQNITLHSGQKSDFKIECDALTDEDIETIAYLISKKYNFYKVAGVPSGGLKIQKALEKYCDKNSKIFLIVDDVLTTGKSMIEFKEKLIQENPELAEIVYEEEIMKFGDSEFKTSVGKINNKFQGVVIFSRSKNDVFETTDDIKTLGWIDSIFNMW